MTCHRCSCVRHVRSRLLGCSSSCGRRRSKSRFGCSQPLRMKRRPFVSCGLEFVRCRVCSTQ